MKLQNMKSKQQATKRSKTKMTTLEQEIQVDRESWLEKKKFHLGEDAGEGHQWEKYVEEHGIPLLGEKQGVQSKNQELEG